MSHTKRAGSPRARQGCIRQNWLDHLACTNSEPRVARTSQAKLARPALARHPTMSQKELAGQPCARQLRIQSCEGVSGGTGRTISHAAYRSPESRGCRRRNLPDHLSRGLSKPRVATGRVRRRARAPPPRPPPGRRRKRPRRCVVRPLVFGQRVRRVRCGGERAAAARVPHASRRCRTGAL